MDRQQYTFIYTHDNGFAFLFENLEKDRSLLIKMNLTIENLFDSSKPQPEAIPDSLEWRMRVEPGKFELRELSIGDITKRTSLKYAFNFKNYQAQPLADTNQIIDRCIEFGTKYQVDFDGKPYNIFYYSYVLDDRQYWAFLNEEAAKTFQGNFKLKLTNMLDEHGQKEADWAVSLGPGQKTLKALTVVEPFEKVSLSFSSSYVVK